MHEGPESEDESILSGGSDLLMADAANFTFSSGSFHQFHHSKGLPPCNERGAQWSSPTAGAICSDAALISTSGQ